MVHRQAATVVGLVAGSHAVNHAYIVLFAPAFPLLQAEFDVSLAAVGVALGVVNVVVTAGQLPLGYVSDAYSHTAVLVGSLSVGTVGVVLAAIAPTYEWLLVAAAVIGLGIAGHHPAHYPLISASTTDAYRSRAYSVHGFAGALGLVFPFAVVPITVALGGSWRAAFVGIAAIGACYTVLTILAVRRIPRSIARAGAVATTESTAVDSQSLVSAPGVLDRIRMLGRRLRRYGCTLAGSPLILLLTGLWFVTSVAVWGIRSYTPTLLQQGYGLSPEVASTIAAAMLVVGAVVLLGGGYVADRTGPMPLLFVGYGSLLVVASVVATERLPVVAAVGVVLTLAATIDVSRPARATLTDLASNRGDVGKNFGLVTIGVSSGGAVAPPVFGYVIETVSVGAAFYAIAATAALALALSIAVGRTRTTDRGKSKHESGSTG